MRFFFYGTLMDADLLSTVIGRRVRPSTLKPALLPGFRRVTPKVYPYPIVIPDKSGCVKGVIIDSITPHEQKRLTGYEDDGYELMRVTVQLRGPKHVKAFVYCGVSSTFAVTKKIWSLKEWQKRHKAAAISEILRAR